MRSSRKPGRRLRPWLMAAVAALVLAACGGGTSQYEAFVPGRLLVFGDETSALTDDGRKYSINGLVASSVVDIVDCSLLKNWVQQLAANYGFVFAQCNPNSVNDTNAIMRAAAGAKVADIQVQIDSQTLTGGFRQNDLTTMLAGANDIIELYQQYPGREEADIANEIGQRGKLLAQQINRLVGLGAKVIVVTVPDLGVTPYALQQKQEFTDTDRAALLTRLTQAFNEQLGANIVLDGHWVGLVEADLTVDAMVRSPGSYSLANVTDAACLDSAPLPDCTTHTLVDGASTAWMWADALRIGPTAQAQIANAAIDRAQRNPF